MVLASVTVLTYGRILTNAPHLEAASGADALRAPTHADQSTRVVQGHARRVAGSCGSTVSAFASRAMLSSAVHCAEF